MKKASFGSSSTVKPSCSSGAVPEVGKMSRSTRCVLRRWLCQACWREDRRRLRKSTLETLSSPKQPEHAGTQEALCSPLLSVLALLWLVTLSVGLLFLVGLVPARLDTTGCRWESLADVLSYGFAERPGFRDASTRERTWTVQAQQCPCRAEEGCWADVGRAVQGC